MSEAQPEAGPGQGAKPPPEKRILRRHFRNLRATAVVEAAPLILAAARRDLPVLLRTDCRLGLYWPLAGEPDLLPLAAEHPFLALPAVAGEPPRLLYRPWKPGTPLAPDRYGIPAPLGPGRVGASESDATGELEGEAAPDAQASEEALPAGELGLLLVPALAFDPHSGIRLGYGGGWYDRLRADPAWRTVPALAVLPAACLCPGLPREPWDAPFTGWLDEHGVHRLAGRPADAPEQGDPTAGRL